MDKCQDFIDKVSELRFLKIKDRQISKFNRLLLKKEGNVTCFTNRANPQAGSASAVPPQAGSSWAESVDTVRTSPQAVSTIPKGDSAAHPPGRYFPGGQH